LAVTWARLPPSWWGLFRLDSKILYKKNSFYLFIFTEIQGNTILWKPSDTAVLSNWVIFKVLEEAGVPPGVINFVPSDGPLFGKTVTASPHLAAINFTGSVA
jgi:delta 1-pyrroline-5-carboxylate dehydrogenase